jgi:transmembrane sensor
VTAVDTGRIGTWRQGRLVYESAPLTLVATDLGRYAGIHLEVPANLKDRRFSGMLAIADAKRAPRDLAQIMGLALVRGAHGPVLSVRPR